jgi:hypothetical protein
VTKRRDDVGHIGGLLCLAIEGGGVAVGGDRPAVVLNRGTGRVRLDTAGVGLYWIGMHSYQVGFAA